MAVFPAGWLLGQQGCASQSRPDLGEAKAGGCSE